MIHAERKLHVLRNVDHHRARPAGGRHVERLMQHARQVLDVAHQPVVLGAGARDADGVAFLERVVADQMRRHLAGDADQRNGIHQRVGQRRHHVGRAGARGHQHDARQAGGARIAFGRVARALLVADEDVLHVALLENLVVDRQHRAAGIAEDVLDAVILERAHDHRCAGHLGSARWPSCRSSLAPVRLWRGSCSGNKKGPLKGPGCTAVPADGLSRPGRCSRVRQ